MSGFYLFNIGRIIVLSGDEQEKYGKEFDKLIKRIRKERVVLDG